MLGAAGRGAAPDLAVLIGSQVSQGRGAVLFDHDGVGVSHDVVDPFEAEDVLIDIFRAPQNGVNVGDGGGEYGVAVSRLAQNVFGSDQAAGTGLVVNHDGGVGVLGSDFGELTGGNVHAAAGLNVVHDGDGSSGLPFGAGNGHHAAQQNENQNQGQLFHWDFLLNIF